MAATTEGQIKEDYGTRTFGSTVEDSTIESKTKINIKRASPTLAEAHVNVKSFNQVLLITGQVPNYNDKDIITAIAEKTRNVKRVHNEVEVGPNSSLLTRANDNLLITKIKGRFIGTDGVVAGRIDVLVENGTVFLMGLVKQQEAERAVNATKRTSGIKKIVKVFEYID
jgi:osmotically-inducible protein OsmY